MTFSSFIQGLVFLLVAPLVVGTLRWAKARLQRRQGATPFQFYRDLLKLLRKRPVTPDSASWIFVLVPIIVFFCYGSLGFLVPVFFLPAAEMSPTGDLLVLVYFLGLARLAMGLAGMDTGTPFGGLGSSRELLIHALIEPTLILALVLVTLAEAGRLPFDNPASHLELTMFGKAIHLEYAGPLLALLEWAEALRLTFFMTLLANLFGPWLLAVAGNEPLLNMLLALLYPAKLLILVLALAFWEALQVKTRLRAVVTPTLTALAITLIAAVLALAERYLR
jgi:formate hydrogenlyase subunit 4